MKYDMNLKPIVKTPSQEKAFNQATYHQGDKSKSPLTKVATPRSPFSKKIMPKNKVTSASSASLQKASRLSGKVTMDGNAVKLS